MRPMFNTLYMASRLGSHPAEILSSPNVAVQIRIQARNGQCSGPISEARLVKSSGNTTVYLEPWRGLET